MTNHRYGGLLGLIAFTADAAARGVTDPVEVDRQWKVYLEVQRFVDMTGCSIDEAVTHRQILTQPECIHSPEINTRH